MSGIMLLFLAGFTAFAFVVVSVRNRQMGKGLRAILLLVAISIAAYVGWIFLSAALSKGR
jgi:hypothetical protein